MYVNKHSHVNWNVSLHYILNPVVYLESVHNQQLSYCSFMIMFYYQLYCAYQQQCVHAIGRLY